MIKRLSLLNLIKGLITPDFACINKKPKLNGYYGKGKR